MARVTGEDFKKKSLGVELSMPNYKGQWNLKLFCYEKITKLGKLLYRKFQTQNLEVFSWWIKADCELLTKTKIGSK